MIQTNEDIHDKILIVMDLEWIGNSFRPHTTHVSQLACKNVRTGSLYSRQLPTMSTDLMNKGAMTAANVYAEWLQWLRNQGDGIVYLIAHNGIRFDAPILRHGMLTHGVTMPSTLRMVDSLYHIRYHGRVWETKPAGYSIDHLCAYFNISVEPDLRHTAAYDVELLCNILNCASNANNVPFVSGAVHDMSTLSTMLVHGIGPVVYSALPCSNLAALCAEILHHAGDLREESCLAYLASVKLKQHVPLCNVDTISKGILNAAKQYLHYIE